MLAFKNIRAILPTRLPSRLFIIRQSSAFCLILKNGDLAEHLIGPAAEALKLRPSACTKGCKKNPLWGSSPRKHPVRKRRKYRLCFKSWLSPASNRRIRHTGKRRISSNKNFFHCCQSLLSLLGTVYILANWPLLPLPSLYLKQWAWHEISQFFVNSGYHTIIVCKKYLTFS